MKVYCFKPNGGYQGGCVIVAANSPLEALDLICKESPFNRDYTDIEHCVEIISLKTDVKEPTIIVDTFYIE